jgi:beta-phosphoglucomutase family hydrolase
MPHDHTERASRAVLWDVDGTLLDSAEYHWQSWQSTLAAENFDLTREHFFASFGQRNDTILRLWFGSDFPDREIARIADAKEAQYRDLIRAGGAALLPGVQHWLQRLRDDGWLQAVASSAPRANIEAILDVLEIRRFFGAITSAEDVSRGKPDPQVFLTAAAKLGVSPDRCVVVEDAPAGVEGARRGGMRAIGVLTSQAALHADLVVPTLDRLPADAFDHLVPRSDRE